MFEVLRTNEPVLLSFAENVLRQAGFSPMVADTHMSVLDGSVMAIPRRLLVPTDEGPAAKATLERALKDAEATQAEPEDDFEAEPE